MPAHVIESRQPVRAVPTMPRYDVGLDVRHALARRLILATMVLYSDGPLTAEDVGKITDAVGVLAGLLKR